MRFFSLAFCCVANAEPKASRVKSLLNSMNLTPEEAWKIKDPAGVWYGPHECNGCGATVVKLSVAQGGIALDAPHNHHYPNHIWQKHICKPLTLTEISNARSQGVILQGDLETISGGRLYC